MPPLRVATPRPASAELRMSYAQERMWFLQQFAPGSAVFNMPRFIQLSGPLDTAALERSLNTLMTRHESLRTVFENHDGQPVPVVLPVQHRPLHISDLSSLTPEQQQAEIARIVDTEIHQPFDLASGPLIRFGLLRLGAENHILRLTPHHIVTDAWSARIFNTELSALYNADVCHEPVSLPDLPIQYGDFAYWQRQWFEDGSFQKQLDYWQQQLHGDLPVLDLAVDRPDHGDTRKAVGHRYQRSLPPALTADLKALSRREKVTLFMTLLAGYDVLLSRYTGLTDILIGSPVANRNRTEIEPLIGFFVNTLVLRTDLSGTPTFREVLSRARRVALEAFSNQDIPFEKLLQVLRPDRDLNHSPLFQVLINMRERGREHLHLHDLSLDHLSLPSELAKFDLSLELEDSGDQIVCRWEYDTGLLDTAAVEGIHRHFEALLQAVAADPELSISEVPILSAEERHHLLVEWNTTARPYSLDGSLHGLFEEQARRTPDATAFILGGDRLTFGALNERANRLARTLQKRGAAPGQVVGVSAVPSFEMMIAVIATLKTGAAYLPLDPAHPAERLTYMAQDAGVRLVVAGNAAEELSLPGAETIWQDQDAAAISGEPADNLDVPAGDIAYVLYTSGSTGTPKGVQGTHRSEINAFQWMWDTYPFAADDVGAVKTSLSFIDSTWELFGELLKGVPSVIVPADATRDPGLLVDILATENVTRLFLVPSLLEAILDTVPDMAGRLPALRFWISSGEALPAALLRRFQQAKPDSILYNLYGTSEVGGDATWYAPDPAHADLPRVPIGKPIANVSVYVLDDHMQPVPPGVPGQVYVGGVALARGYLNQSALTAEKFVRDPFSQDPDARLYKTGDVGRYLADGNLDYLRRADQQIKIRGQRIDPSEVEEALRGYPGLRQSAVVARVDSQGQNALAAYLVFDGDPASPADVQHFLRRKLPQVMIPAAFVSLDSLPLTPSGKLDRRALPAPGSGPAPAAASDNAPHTARQRQLVAIWQEMLGRQDVGIHDDFFNLGGHSLLAVRLLSRIKQETGRTIPLATMFHAATVAQQAKLLRRRKRRKPTALIALQKEGSRPPLFCVHAIQGGVFLYRRLLPALGPDQPVYALQARGVDERDQPMNRVEDMAAVYVKAIRSVQPEGPYYVCGYSFGGLPAYEIAQQLRAAGQEVAFLAMIDTGWQAPMPTWLKRKAARKVYSFLAGLVILPLRYRLPYLAQTIRLSIRNSRRQRARTPKAPAKVLPPHIEQIAAAGRQADATYRPTPYNGKITYFRAIHNSINVRVFRQLRRLGQGGVEFHDIPGSHKSIMHSPNVEVLGKAFHDCLERAHSEYPVRR